MIWLLLAAHGASPEWALGASARLWDQGDGVSSHGPVGAAGWAVSPWLQPELYASWESGALAGGPRLRLRRGALSLSAGGGLDTDLQTLAEAAFALDLPVRDRLGIRLATVYRAHAHSLNGGLVLSLVRAASPRDETATPQPTTTPTVATEPAPEPTAEATPEPTPAPAPVEAAPPTVEIHPPDAWVWLPHPDCVWVPAAQAASLLDPTQPGKQVWIEAPTYIPQAAELSEPLVVDLQPAPDQGALIIAATPRDRAQVGAQVVQLDDDGIAVVASPEGTVEVSVIGGGRAWRQEVAVASGYALWLHAPPPPEQTVLFRSGSATPGTADRARLRSIARSAGGWSFEVVGSYSAEGNPDANLRLANARAQAIIDALLAAGLPPDRVRLGTPRPPDPQLSAAAQRSAHIIARGEP